MILDQRSEVETFFLEALEQIKREYRKRVEQERKDAVTGNSVQVEVISNTILFLFQGKEKQKYGDKVDLCELEWEDRERVLRLLFAKMNAGVPPPLWRENLPAIENKQSQFEPFKEEDSQGVEDAPERENDQNDQLPAIAKPPV